MDDLDRAITMNEQAVASTPDDHPDRAGRLNNLGIALQSRFERTGSMDDLDRAITTNEQAVASTPDDHPDRAGCTSTTWGVHCRADSRGQDRWTTSIGRSRRTSRLSHPPRMTILIVPCTSTTWGSHCRADSRGQDRWTTSIGRSRRTSRLSHPPQMIILIVLQCSTTWGIALQSRFERTGSMDDLDRAITTNEQAVASTPDDHPNRAACISTTWGARCRRDSRGQDRWTTSIGRSR